jgi:hypothetical protein
MAAMVLLTAIVLVRMVLLRIAAVKRGEIDARFYKTYQGDTGETRKVAQHNRHFVNLFENPVLFYAACIVAMVTGQGTQGMVWLAWTYVATRIVHTFIHLGSNKIYPRMAIYGISWVVLLAMWVTLVTGVANAP